MAEHKADNFRDRISSWDHVAELIQHFSYFIGNDWLFRGVLDASYSLVPKIGRKETRRFTKETVPPAWIPYRGEDELAVLSMFKQQARPYLDSIPQNDLEWLATAQHFGLATRLLDWTDMLLSALWFAVVDGGGEEKDSALWVAKEIPSVDESDLLFPFKITEHKAYRPPHINRRIAAQGSVLMICPNPTAEVHLPFLKRIVIEYNAQFTIKKRLNACGINARNLFPDLDGLTRHLNWMYKNNWLAGYRSSDGCKPSVIPADGYQEDDASDDESE